MLGKMSLASFRRHFRSINALAFQWFLDMRAVQLGLQHINLVVSDFAHHLRINLLHSLNHRMGLSRTTVAVLTQRTFAAIHMHLVFFVTREITRHKIARVVLVHHSGIVGDCFEIQRG